MKILVAPGVEQITSTQGRVIRPGTPTGRPDCFKSISIDCASGSIYLTFTDGSIYEYDKPAVDVARAIIRADCHGAEFNRLYRRAVAIPNQGTWSRVFAVPPTAVVRYLDPPYPGADPGPCPPQLWATTLWTQADAYYTGAGGSIFSPSTPGPSDTCQASSNTSMTSRSGYCTMTGTWEYRGQALQSSMHLTFASAQPASAWLEFSANVSCNGPNLLFEQLTVIGNGSFDIPFTVPDSTILTGHIEWGCNMVLNYGYGSPMWGTISLQITSP